MISRLFEILNKVLLIIKAKVAIYLLKHTRNPVRYALPKVVIRVKLRLSGELAEWSKAAVLKTVEP